MSLIFNFRILKTLQTSIHVVVGLANMVNPALCVFWPVTDYVSAAWRVESDMTAWLPFPVLSTEKFLYSLHL